MLKLLHTCKKKKWQLHAYTSTTVQPFVLSNCCRQIAPHQVRIQVTVVQTISVWQYISNTVKKKKKVHNSGDAFEHFWQATG
jgi:hypothetical protein